MIRSDDPMVFNFMAFYGVIHPALQLIKTGQGHLEMASIKAASLLRL